MAQLAENRMVGNEPSYSPSSVWDQNFDQTAQFIEQVHSESESESPYIRPSIWWESQTVSVPLEFNLSSDAQELVEEVSHDTDLGDRLALLVKKYALESAALVKEDSARLEILNGRVDLKYSRYTERDFEVIAEADEILEKFKNLEADR